MPERKLKIGISRATLLAGAVVTGAVATVVGLSVIPAEWVPRTRFGSFGDHFIAYASTALVVCIAARPRSVWPLGVLGTVLAAILETVQIALPYRQARLVDFSGSVTGLWLALALWIAWKGWRARRLLTS